MFALDQLLRFGRKRGRELFPDGIPGLYPVAKTDINADLDNMQSPSDASSSPGFMSSPSSAAASPTRNNNTGNVRKRRSDQLVTNGTVGAVSMTTNNTVKPSKRSRLIEKISREAKTQDGLEAKQRDLKMQIDALREENKRLATDIEQKQKDVNAMLKEREKKKESYLEVQKAHERKIAFQTSEARMQETMLANLKSNILQMTQKVSFFLFVSGSVLIFIFG
jgi:hypothetical protein